MIFKRLGLIIFIFAFIFPLVSFAGEKDVNKDNLLLFDENTPKFDKFSFDIDELERLKPKKNDFELLHFAPMSNQIGERWVLITVRNKATGHRILKSEHIVATFVNGKQAYPVVIEKSIDGGEDFSETIFFGVSKFPIVMLEIQPKTHVRSD
jgi:hypothetical protein